MHICVCACRHECMNACVHIGMYAWYYHVSLYPETLVRAPVNALPAACVSCVRSFFVLFPFWPRVDGGLDLNPPTTRG